MEGARVGWDSVQRPIPTSTGEVLWVGCLPLYPNPVRRILRGQLWDPCKWEMQWLVFAPAWDINQLKVGWPSCWQRSWRRGGFVVMEMPSQNLADYLSDLWLFPGTRCGVWEREKKRVSLWIYQGPSADSTWRWTTSGLLRATEGSE